MCVCHEKWSLFPSELKAQSETPARPCRPSDWWWWLQIWWCVFPFADNGGTTLRPHDTACGGTQCGAFVATFLSNCRALRYFWATLTYQWRCQFEQFYWYRIMNNVDNRIRFLANSYTTKRKAPEPSSTYKDVRPIWVNWKRMCQIYVVQSLINFLLGQSVLIATVVARKPV